ncbi:MAG: helix-turn-helix domain-containing protein [Halobacteriovoraceae bacterium]|nr:helix-turn-helix domain-containing protein [Halobacteriovoraceae bacterium]
METKNKNYYEILEIPEEASPEEIHKGYMRAKNAYSQDSLALYSLMSPEECNEVLNLIEEAYNILSEPTKRRQYDSARGLNTNESHRVVSREATSGFDMTEDDHSISKRNITTQQNSMTKIVAQNRFSLEYNLDAEFEKEIEQATEFTGDFLKKVREYKGVELNRMADMTKVSKTYIRNIEEEAFEKLPASVYVRGFVYQYAKSLKLNPELVANSFLYRLKKAKGEH